MAPKNFNHLSSILRDAIQQEAGALLDFSASIPDSMCQAVELVHSKQNNSRLVCTGMGKSGYIASKVCATLISTGTPSQFLHPAEALHGDLGMILPNDIILAFSNSGETEEILRLLPFFKDNLIPVVSIVGKENSTLARFSDICISYAIEKEACPHNLAPTTSTTLSLAIGDALAIGLMKNRSFAPIDFAKFHPGGSLGKKLLGSVIDYLAPCPVVSPNDMILSVAKSILKNKALIAAVVESNKVVGAITLGDLVRSLSSSNENGVNFVNVNAGQCMSDKPLFVNQNTICSHADQIMAESGVNSLIVIDVNGLPIGSYSSSSFSSSSSR
jgi:arabinose-5-phosphate isomerase